MSDLPSLKLPPHSDEAEIAILSAMIANNKLINEIDWIHAEEFYRRENQIIFARIQALAFAGKPVDPVTLVDALEGLGELEQAGGAEYIVELVTSGRGGHNTAHYAMIVREKALGRKMIATGMQIAELGYEQGDISEKVDTAQGLTMALSTSKASEPESVTAIMRLVVEDLDRRSKFKGDIVGLRSGFADLDKLTAGFQDGQLIIVAGRPSMGKTTFAMNIVENVIQQDKFCLTFNLEMTATNLTMKSMASLGRIPYDVMRSGQLGEYGSHLNAAGMKLKEKPLFIDDNASLTSQQILSRARKVSQKMGRKIDFVVVDYMQLLNDKGEGHERITKISRALKLAAKELDCPLLVLSQLNRSLEQRPDKRPIMSDLRESGAIEQDADIIIMLYRDEVYNEDSPDKGIAEAIVRKNREGESGTVYLASNLRMCRFDNMAFEYKPDHQPVKQKRRSAFAYLDE